jgi:hypothetical protein
MPSNSRLLGVFVGKNGENDMEFARKAVFCGA